ncbi:MAG: hypothetical protein HY731_13105 [Candidatus Tectomicrobia bacterium]|nr:hypothetical protein [Candidatus Tectomicrobia bacterium]
MMNDETAMSVTQRHQDNRAAWNEAARRYEQKIEEGIAFLRAGGKNLMAPEYHTCAIWALGASVLSIHLFVALAAETFEGDRPGQ